MKEADNCSQCEIPLELFGIILTYLPVKSVLRFRSMSKPWKSIIEDLNFTSAHLKRCPNNTQNPYRIFCEESLRDRKHSWVLCDSETFKHEVKIESPSGDEKWKICNGVDGLILLHNRKDILLWNPSNRKVFYLPPPEIPLTEPTGYLCLLFDAVSDDYKVVMVLGGDRLIRDGYRLVEVFSLKTQSWRRLMEKKNRAPAKEWFSLNGDLPACIGGSAHWEGCHSYSEEISSGVNRGGVISFDVTSTMFSFIPFPTMDFVNKELIVLSGCILGSLEGFGVTNGYLTLWTMETTSSTSRCWIKKYRIDLRTACYRIFFLTLQNRDILTWGNGLVRTIHYLDNGKLNLLYEENEGLLVYITPYVESLLLLGECDSRPQKL